MNNPAKGWKAPKTKAARKRMLKKHGEQCFLDPANLKYPVCNRLGNVDCRGLAAAKARAASQGRDDLAAKADEMAQGQSCSWSKDENVGWIDWCRVTESGKGVVCLPESTKQEPFDRKAFPKKGEDMERRIRWDSGEWKKKGAPLFTGTSKTRCPSWSLPAGSSCPAVNMPIKRILTDASAKEMSNEKLVDQLVKEIPSKCLACYATGARYAYGEVQRAQHRRMTWFEDTSDSEVIRTLSNAIKKAGKETCSKRSDGEWHCTFEPGKPPEYFRLFDSGDFNSARDVRVWYEIAKRNPNVKFWAPTTAYAACAKTPEEKKKVADIVTELKKFNKLPNVIVRPSGLLVDKPAPQVPGLAPGATVTKEKTGSGRWTNIDGVKHWVCPGDCTKCRHCWTKKTPVTYPLHTEKVDPKNITRIVRTVHGGFSMTKDTKLHIWREVDKLIANRLLSNASMGPETDERMRRD